MPELPEVETIRRGLEDCILNKKIVQVEVCSEKSFVGDVTEVTGRKVVGLRRRGKALLIDLSGGVTLMVHLRMTGQMIYAGEQRFAGGHPSENFVAELPNKQTRVIFKLRESHEQFIAGRAQGRLAKPIVQRQTVRDSLLYFNDQRKFGFIKVIPTDEVEKDAFIASLGAEPWEMKPEDFYVALQRHAKAPIKAVLLDQKVIAGLGNIYADEALYDSVIHPERKAGSLSEVEAENLLKSACKVMDKSLEAGGSTIQNYVKADGTRGNYLDLFAKVYHKDGSECEHCGGKIVKTRVAGRGTHFCPNCQKLPDSRGAADD